MLTRGVEIPPLFGICLEINPIIKIVPICLFHNIQIEFQEFHLGLSKIGKMNYITSLEAKLFRNWSSKNIFFLSFHVGHQCRMVKVRTKVGLPWLVGSSTTTRRAAAAACFDLLQKTQFPQFDNARPPIASRCTTTKVYIKLIG